MGALALGVVGTMIGSFLNVVVYRVPLGRSVVAPPSACPACNTRLRASDNVPVISWVALRGRCRTCASPISMRYPLVELGTALWFALIAWMFLPPVFTSWGSGAAVAAVLELVAFLYLGAVSVALALIDVDTQTLPNRIVLPSYAVGAGLLGAAGCALAGLAGAHRRGHRSGRHVRPVPRARAGEDPAEWGSAM